VVIASHDPDVVERCDDVLELDAGKVVAPAA
jgi:ABC-type lipoprotein export system ATPase subunit